MHFSIIIPVLNEAKSLPACLEALQGLRHQAEIMVVDGGSSDDTLTIATGLADRVVRTHRGRALQMNAGARQAKGDVFLFLHADTFLPDHALTLIQQQLMQGGQWGRFDICLCGRPVMLKVIAQLMNWRSRLTGIATGDQAIFVTRQAFFSVGGYPDIALMEDIALSKLLKNIGPPIYLSAKVSSAGRRWETFGVFRTILLMWSLRLGYFFGADPSELAKLYHRGRFWKP
ncbi:TIGR04283 family arsenosugar biosynthesis glycosyltransferase [Methylomicrobium sp. Wu6]|uniref:TIGR04283 family arsenosugar biosynthesis glycosyltransferase n=1 Tax=Methylomicrobium sp. Wu6 TaxID=3107928 RepID=UPI002DD65AF4|nr:TIGR04283 family arsenosugar biosynthesis glycosyltransferase [Methylomicrobium sp. Wu6]MEC4749681.1 TIGR04283 family arsenosugar biosynthesis glycosyltransferase [Methylomicrobium sp. Wu6]